MFILSTPFYNHYLFRFIYAHFAPHTLYKIDPTTDFSADWLVWLVWKDTTLSLFVDEIHLKPYFNYKGGNIIGLSDNSNEAATNAFIFLCLAIDSHNIRILCILCQLNILKLRIYLT